MEGSTIVWIIVAIIVVGGLVAFALSRSGARRTEAERAKARGDPREGHRARAPAPRARGQRR